MALDKITDRELEEALLPGRVDGDSFESAVRDKLAALDEEGINDPLSRVPGWLRGAAALMPLTLMTGGKAAASGAKLAPSGFAKLIGYLSLPAICIFVVLGVAVFSAFGIRRLGKQSSLPGSANETEIQLDLSRWWRKHWWVAVPIFVLIAVLPMVGPSWLILVALTGSMAVLLVLLRFMAQSRLASRQVVSETCGTGLLHLAISTGIYRGQGELHFLNPWLANCVLWGGTIFLMLIQWDSRVHPSGRLEKYLTRALHLIVATALLGGMVMVRLRSSLVPPDVEQLQEVMDSTLLEGSVDWDRIEMIVTSAMDLDHDLDLTRARSLLVQEIRGAKNPYVLSSASRLGLLLSGDLPALKRELDSATRNLFEWGHPGRFTALGQMDWSIRALVELGELTEAQLNGLQTRLAATWTAHHEEDRPYVVLKDFLRITELREVIGRPIDVDSRRAEVHDWLRLGFTLEHWELGSTEGSVMPRPLPELQLSDIWYGVQLMKRYGVPDGIDFNWVRWSLQPWQSRNAFSWPWISSLTRREFEALSGIPQPTLGDVLSPERNLIAALLLVGLCIYAALSAPKSKPNERPADRLSFALGRSKKV